MVNRSGTLVLSFAYHSRRSLRWGLLSKLSTKTACSGRRSRCRSRNTKKSPSPWRLHGSRWLSRSRRAPELAAGNSGSAPRGRASQHDHYIYGTRSGRSERAWLLITSRTPSGGWHWPIRTCLARRVLAWEAVHTNARFVTTEEVLSELLTWFAGTGPAGRAHAEAAVRGILADPSTQVLPQTSADFAAALTLYEARPDKEYSLTDCRSMVALRAGRFRGIDK